MAIQFFSFPNLMVGNVIFPKFNRPLAPTSERYQYVWKNSSEYKGLNAVRYKMLIVKSYSAFNLHLKNAFKIKLLVSSEAYTPMLMALLAQTARPCSK